MNKIKLFAYLCIAFLLSAPLVANDSIGIIASLSPKKQEKISKAISTKDATQNLIKHSTHPKSQHIYWLERKKLDTYHTSLDLFSRVDSQQLTAADEAVFVGILNNFKATAAKLNQPKNAFVSKNGIAKKAYPGTGYELRLFVHYTDGTHDQFGAKNINDVLQSPKDISYANLVLKIGTHGELRDDWIDLQNNILPQYPAYQRKGNHKLETHITIANIFKYSNTQNQVVNGKVQRNNGKKGFNEPFSAANKREMQLLVDTFNETNNNVKWRDLNDIGFDRAQITTLNQAQLAVLHQVKF